MVFTFVVGAAEAILEAFEGSAVRVGSGRTVSDDDRDQGFARMTRWRVREESTPRGPAVRTAGPTPSMGLLRGMILPGSLSMWLAVNRDGWVTFLRQAAGSSPTPIRVGTELASYFDEASAAALRARLLKAFSGAAFSASLVLEGAKGEARFEVHHVPRFGEGGAVVEVVLLVQDTTSRHEREVERQVLREALDATDAAVVVCEADAALTVVFANSAFSHIAADGIGRPLALLERWVDADGEPLLEGVRRAALEGPRQTRWVTRSAPREVREVHVSPVRSHDGSIRLVAVARDITERLELEERVRRAAALDALGQLAASAAHDFNNLLAAINVELSQLRVALTRGELSQATQSVSEIERGVQQSNAVVSRLLVMARPTPPTPIALDLGRALRDRGHLLSGVCGDHVTLRFRLEDGLLVLADASLLEQVWINLVRNACDAMPDGGTIVIASRKEEHLAVIEVIDEGEGMNEATVARAFEPFFSTKGTRGTGLGLTSVRRIVEDHGGAVRLTSRPGRGTNVAVWLPLVAAFEAEPVVEERDSTRVTGEFAALTPRHVLVVDDQDVLRRGLARGLRRAGYVVSEARDGVEALEVIRGPVAVDLVLSDVVMPRMTGIELVRAVQQDWPGIRVLMMSGYSDPQLGALPQGIDLLEKPFPTSVLLDRIGRMLDEDD